MKTLPPKYGKPNENGQLCQLFSLSQCTGEFIIKISFLSQNCCEAQRKFETFLLQHSVYFVLSHSGSLCIFYTLSMAFFFHISLLLHTHFRATGHFHFLCSLHFFGLRIILHISFCCFCLSCSFLCCTAGQDSASEFKYFVVMALNRERRKQKKAVHKCETLKSSNVISFRTTSNRSLVFETSIKDTQKLILFSSTEKHSMNSF